MMHRRCFRIRGSGQRRQAFILLKLPSPVLMLLCLRAVGGGGQPQRRQLGRAAGAKVDKAPLPRRRFAQASFTFRASIWCRIECRTPFSQNELESSRQRAACPGNFLQHIDSAIFFKSYELVR